MHDLCAACGEEHEPPRGTKCKRARLNKWAVKTELPSSEEETETEWEQGKAEKPAEKAALAMVTAVSGLRLVVEDYEEDEEERELLRHGGNPGPGAPQEGTPSCLGCKVT